MRAFILKRREVRIEMNHVERALYIDEHALPQIGRVHLDITDRDIEILPEALHELCHTRGLLAVALHAVVVAVLHAPEKDHRQKQQDDEIAVARGKAAAQILDAHDKQRREREKRNDIPRRMACLSNLLNIAVGIKCQRSPPFHVRIGYYAKRFLSMAF